MVNEELVRPRIAAMVVVVVADVEEGIQGGDGAPTGDRDGAPSCDPGGSEDMVDRRPGSGGRGFGLGWGGWRGGSFDRRREEESPDLQGINAVAAGEVVLREEVGEVLVGGDGDEGVKVIRRQLAPKTHRSPPAHLP